MRCYEEVLVLLKLYEEVEVGNMEGALFHREKFVEGCLVVDGNVANL